MKSKRAKKVLLFLLLCLDNNFCFFRLWCLSMSSSQTASSSHLSDSSLSDVDSNRSSSLSEDSDDEIEATKVAKQVKEEKKLKLIPLDYDLEEDEEVEHELLSIPEGRIESNWEVAVSFSSGFTFVILILDFLSSFARF